MPDRPAAAKSATRRTTLTAGASKRETMPSGSRDPRSAIVARRWTVDEALAAARTFVFPSLPPGVNHRLVGGWHLTKEARSWAAGAALIVGGWTPPPRTWLTVRVDLEVPAKMLKRTDIDSTIKPLLDATVGPRRDQWICHLDVSKREGDGSATVYVAPWVPWSER